MDGEGLTLAGTSRRQMGPGSYPCPLRSAFLKRKPSENSSTFAVLYESCCKETSNQRSLLSQDKDLLPEAAQGHLLEVRVEGQHGLQQTCNHPPSLRLPLRWVYWGKITAIQLRWDAKIFPTTKAHFKCIIDGTTLFVLSYTEQKFRLSCKLFLASAATWTFSSLVEEHHFWQQVHSAPKKIRYLPCFVWFALFRHKWSMSQVRYCSFLEGRAWSLQEEMTFEDELFNSKWGVLNRQGEEWPQATAFG